MTSYRYPCTGYIDLKGFGQFLEDETRSPRYNINAFTNELKERFQAPFLTLVNSGSSANLVAALVLAEKIRKAGLPMTAAVSAFTFPTTISSLALAGFEIRIVDTEEGGFNISLKALEEMERENALPTVVAATHFLGFPMKVREIADLVHRHGGFLLQDGCETLHMETDGALAFEYGDIFTWSFYHPHHLSAYGGGGIITLNQDDYLLVDSTAHWGRSCKCHVDHALCQVPEGPAHQFTYERLGVNVEISELNACFGRWQLRRWDEFEEKRLRNYQILYDELRDADHLRVWKTPNVNGSAFVFPVQLTDGRTIDDAYRILVAEGVEIRTLMGGVSNEQQAFVSLLGSEVQPHAHEMAKTTFFVGIHQTLPEEDVRTVAKKLKERLSSNNSSQ